jgi:hypothetical protein
VVKDIGITRALKGPTWTRVDVWGKRCVWSARLTRTHAWRPQARAGALRRIYAHTRTRKGHPRRPGTAAFVKISCALLNCSR